MLGSRGRALKKEEGRSSWLASRHCAGRQWGVGRSINEPLLLSIFGRARKREYRWVVGVIGYVF